MEMLSRDEKRLRVRESRAGPWLCERGHLLVEANCSILSFDHKSLRLSFDSREGRLESHFKIKSLEGTGSSRRINASADLDLGDIRHLKGFGWLEV